MQRTGAGAQPGLVYVLNNLGDAWNGATVQTQWQGVQFQPVAYGGNDTSRPESKTTSADGRADFWAAREDGRSMRRRCKQLSVELGTTLRKRVAAFFEARDVGFMQQRHPDFIQSVQQAMTAECFHREAF